MMAAETALARLRDTAATHAAAHDRLVAAVTNGFDNNIVWKLAVELIVANSENGLAASQAVVALCEANRESILDLKRKVEASLVR